MGIDCLKGHKRKGGRKNPKSKNLYLALLVNMYKLLARRSKGGINKQILRRMCMSKINRPCVSTSALKLYSDKKENVGKQLVVVGTVTNDERIQKLPPMKVVALRFTESARISITSSGGSVMTFDQAVHSRPDGGNSVLIQGKRKCRTANKYFGKATGLPGSHARPRVQSKGRKFERAKGR